MSLGTAAAAQIPPAAARGLPALVTAAKWMSDAIGQILVGKAFDRVTGESVRRDLQAADAQLRTRAATDPSAAHLVSQQMRLTESYLTTMQMLLQSRPSKSEIRLAQQHLERDEGRLIDLLVETTTQLGIRLGHLENAMADIRAEITRPSQVPDTLLQSIQRIAESTGASKSDRISDLEEELRAAVLEDSIRILRRPTSDGTATKTPWGDALLPAAVTISYMGWRQSLTDTPSAGSYLVTFDYEARYLISRNLGLISLSPSYVGGFVGLSSRLPAFSASESLLLQSIYAFLQAGGSVGRQSARSTSDPTPTGIAFGGVAIGGVAFQFGPASVRFGVSAAMLSRSGRRVIDAYLAGLGVGW